MEAGWPVFVFYTGDTEEENFRLQNPQIDAMNLIADIESVTLESEPKIVAARQKFDSLTEEQKALVTNYEDLVNAELALQALKAQAGIEVDKKKFSVAAAQGEAGEGQVPVAPEAPVVP